MNKKFFRKSLLMSFTITTIFFILNIIDVYLENNFITGYKKIFLKTPIHFALIFTVTFSFLYLFSLIFKTK